MVDTKNISQQLLSSGLLPTTVKTWQAAAVIIQRGTELGFTPLQSFSYIFVVNGKMCISSEGMRYLLFIKYPDVLWHYEKLDSTCCTIATARPGQQKQSFTFSMEDAKRAGIASGATWSKYPSSMMLARCTAIAVRALFPEVIGGISFTPEEIKEIEPQEISVIGGYDEANAFHRARLSAEFKAIGIDSEDELKKLSAAFIGRPMTELNEFAKSGHLTHSDP